MTIRTSQGNAGSQCKTQGYAKFGVADGEDEEGFKTGDEWKEGEDGGLRLRTAAKLA